jgi:AraC-like DNA-binding protein
MISSGDGWLSRISPAIRPISPGTSIQSFTNHGPAPHYWLEALRVIYDHELVIFQGERFITEISGEKFICPDGSFIIVPPGEWHTSYSGGKCQGHRYWTHFDWIYQGPYGETPIFTFHPASPRADLYRRAPKFVPKGVIQGTVPNMQRAVEIHERLTMMQLYGSAHEKSISRAVLLQLLLEILDTSSRSEAAYGDHVELADRVRNALENAVWNLSQTPPVQELLMSLGYSYAHLCRSFRARYGITPNDFIHTLKITRAKMLLTDTDLNVSEIGYRTGFNSPTYFTLLFRRMTKMTPSEYRKMSRVRPST